MREKNKAIVLDIRHHNEKTDIITIYTDLHGRVVTLSPVSASVKGKARRARLQPLSVIETELNFNPEKEFHRLGGVSPAAVWSDIYYHPMKRLTAFFIAEFLNKLLRATMPDTELWQFIYSSLEDFDNMTEGYNDFHIIFLFRLLKFAGIQPNSENYEKGYFFDMREGKFVYNIPSHNDLLKDQEAAFASIAHRLNYTNIRKLKLTAHARRRILSSLLKYYAIHFPGTGNLKTLNTLSGII